MNAKAEETIEDIAESTTSRIKAEQLREAICRELERAGVNQDDRAVVRGERHRRADAPRGRGRQPRAYGRGSGEQQNGEDDGRACTPIMKLFGRAAIPTTTHDGVESIIERKMKAGGTSRPWEIFENMLGETYGARGRKAD